MYKLMLVDDEEDVREGLLQEIDWEALGFVVVETAENGQEAIECIERSEPDIVVTDIHMPFMNGLQLAEWVRSHDPSIKIMILTGYDEFEYAQKAIKLQIDEYVLKPFSAADLKAALIKVKQQMDQEAAEKNNLITLKEHYIKSLPVLHRVFLSSLIARKCSLDEIRDKCERYELDISGSTYMVSAIQMDNNHQEENRYLLQFAVFNIAEEIVMKHRYGQVFMHHDHVVVLSISTTEDDGIISQETMDVLEEILQNVHRFLKITVTIGAGTVVRGLTELSSSYQEAVQALHYRLIHGNHRVIWIQDVEVKRENPLVFDDLKEQALIRCMKVGTMEEAQQMMDELFVIVESAPVSLQDFQIYWIEIWTAMMKVAKDMDVNYEQLFGSSTHPMMEIYQCNNALEAKNRMSHLCMKLMNCIAVERQTGYKKLVDEAKSYMKLHYAEQDISIHTVCKQLHISTGYFSHIFKKEAKTTFVNYLVDLRMEAAKELLRSTDLKAFEIGEKVGYSDPNYFSFSFRKRYGLSPKEYRNHDRG
ncbi:DNA-binding response regulator [Paenibacillus selenitireducens]|uniref:DNA-binding response regulator n=1 Tax=Paenibacillus selenitireducens TaxID=1324314 RepID=A0A1T2X1H3_9BACL|nr:response regulator [Paenibacillus selenitireducens]OPA73710.1 DNA-binding response regulator [Paenibacillus selenitireducens]